MLSHYRNLISFSQQRHFLCISDISARPTIFVVDQTFTLFTEYKREDQGIYNAMFLTFLKTSEVMKQMLSFV